MNLCGVKVSFYWAEFSKDYLNTVRNRKLSKLTTQPKIKLNHTEPKSLMNPDQRGEVIKEFAQIVGVIKAGIVPVGHLRTDVVTSIHRDVEIKTSTCSHSPLLTPATPSRAATPPSPLLNDKYDS
jgi:hypothetical protein